MIDLHTHTYFSDGELGVAELARRAEEAGWRVLGIADHADHANVELVVPCVARAAKEMNGAMKIRIVPGVELTHVPPKLLPELIRRARELGAQYVVVHGETIIEPVAAGTNAAAIEGGADILAHPGMLTLRDAKRAAARGVLLEITTRKGHAYTNGHVAAMARAAGARMVLNSDAHAVGDLMREEMSDLVARGAGLTAAEIRACRADARRLVGCGAGSDNQRG